MAQVKGQFGATLTVLTLVYFAAGRLGLSLAFINDSASAVWPPTGIALAALLVLGLGAWPAILAGAFLVNVTTSGAVLPSIAIAIGNTLEGVVGAWLIMRYAGGRAAFERPGDIVRFTLIAAVATGIAALVGASTLQVFGLAQPADFASIALTWWLGDAVGATVVTPLILLWLHPSTIHWTRARVLEVVLLALVLLAVCLFVFTSSTAGLRNYPLQGLVYPVLLWSAFRFRPRETATALAAVAVMAIVGTLNGYGPFALATPNESLLVLQLFIGVASVLLLAVAAEVGIERRGSSRIRALNEELEQRVAERTEELTREHQRLVEAQKVAHVGSWEWDVGSNSLSWSEELYRIYGVSPSEAATYESFLQSVHPDDREFVNGIVSRATTDGAPFEFDHRVLRPDGTVRVLHAHGRVERNEAGAAVRMMGTGHDVTERKQAEEERAQLIHEQAARREAEDANLAKDQFLAMLSHELRTPLNVALGWSRMLRDLPYDAARFARAVETIYRNLVVETRLVSDIMDISRITKGTMPLDMGPVDLTAVLDSALDTVRGTAAARDVTLHTRIPPDAIALTGDTRRLQQVLWNLLSNAVKFAREGGRVEVTVMHEDDTVEIAVADDGPGIDPAFLPHVFEQFRQADASPTREHGGLGLGLAIARHIVEQHGGTIAAANRDDGGAVLTVRLPAAVTVAAH
jgi:PAS domain S-box-containing protein